MPHVGTSTIVLESAKILWREMDLSSFWLTGTLTVGFFFPALRSGA